MMLLMWAAEWPLDKTTGRARRRVRPTRIVDYHVIYALALIAVAATYAGDHLGLGRVVGRLPFVRRFRPVLR